jgi:hypothetical protein
MTTYGVFNGNSRNSQYIRDAQQSPAKAPGFDLYHFAERAYLRLQAAQYLIQGGLTRKGEMLRDECEKQLTLLAEFVDEEAEAEAEAKDLFEGYNLLEIRQAVILDALRDKSTTPDLADQLLEELAGIEVELQKERLDRETHPVLIADRKQDYKSDPKLTYYGPVLVTLPADQQNLE